nr:hypothetical protein [Clostridia bacterium]
MELKSRKEMNPQYMWDFTHIFPNKQAWEDAYKQAWAQVETLPALEGTLGKSADSLKHALDAVFAAAQKAELVYLYASLHKSGDNGDAEYQAMEDRCIRLMTKFETAIASITPEILSIPEKTLEAYMADEALKTYRHHVHDINRARAHTLDAERERLLAMLGEAAQAPSNAFGMLE